MTTPKFGRKPNVTITIAGKSLNEALTKSYIVEHILKPRLTDEHFHVTVGEPDPPPRNPTQTWVHVQTREEGE